MEAVKLSTDSLKEAAKSAKELAERLKKGIDAAAKAGASAVKAASNAFGALGKLALGYNSQLEQHTVSLTAMLGSEEAALQKLEELKSFAAATPLSLNDLAQATQTLLAFGVASDDSTGALRQLGDIALGDAGKLQQLSAAFGQATAQGKVTDATVQQMISAGWDPLVQIAQAAGETMEQTRQRMREGAVSVEELQAAMEAVTSGSGPFAGGLEAAGRTTEGLLSTLKENATAKLGEAFSKLSDILREELLPRALEFVESIDAQQLAAAVEKGVEAFIRFSPVIAAAAAAIAAFRAAASISGVFQALKTATEGQTNALKALNAAMNGNAFIWIATLIAGVVSALVTLYMTNEEFREKVNAAWEAVKATVAWVAEALGVFFTQTLPELLGAGVQMALGILSGLVETVALLFTQVIPSVLTGFNAWLSEVFATDWNTLFGPVLGGVVGAFFANLQNIFEGVKQIFGGLITFLTGVFTGNWQQAWEGIRQIFGGIFDSLAALAKTPLNGIIGLLNGAIGAVNCLINGFNGLGFTLPRWLGGGSWYPNLPNIPAIPYLANGGTLLQGAAIVGEAGPELLTVLGGRAKVLPLAQGERVQPVGGGVINITVNGARYSDENALVRRILQELQFAAERRGAAFGGA